MAPSSVHSASYALARGRGRGRGRRRDGAEPSDTSGTLSGPSSPESGSSLSALSSGPGGGRRSAAAQDSQDHCAKPVPRPEEWGGELPEDPISNSQATPAKKLRISDDQQDEDEEVQILEVLVSATEPVKESVSPTAPAAPAADSPPPVTPKVTRKRPRGEAKAEVKAEAKGARRKAAAPPPGGQAVLALLLRKRSVNFEDCETKAGTSSESVSTASPSTTSLGPSTAASPATISGNEDSPPVQAHLDFSLLTPSKPSPPASDEDDAIVATERRYGRPALEALFSPAGKEAASPVHKVQEAEVVDTAPAATAPKDVEDVAVEAEPPWEVAMQDEAAKTAEVALQGEAVELVEGEGEEASSSAVPIAQLLSAVATFPTSKAAVEATVLRRDVARNLGRCAFRVRIKDQSGEVDAAFVGAAAQALANSPALQMGSRVRLEGFQIAPTKGNAKTRSWELRFTDLQALRVTALDQDELSTLKALLTCKIGERLNVKATVDDVGQLEQLALPLQPGEFLATRRLLLADGADTCEWAAWGPFAERLGPELRGRRVAVRGAVAREVDGARRLAGCTGWDLLPPGSS